MTSNRQNLATLVSDFEKHGRDIAIVSSRGLRETSTTYQQLAKLSRRFAADLERRLIHKGDRVIIWGDNSAEWTAAFFGCLLAGVLPVPLDAVGSLDFAIGVLTDIKPRLIVGDGTLVKSLSGEVLPFSDFALMLPESGPILIQDLKSSDPVQIIFTSGTTGKPKGIVHTHDNVLASLEPIEKEINKYLKLERPFHPLRILHTLPLSHVFGQFMGLWTPVLLSAEVHYESRPIARQLVEKIKSSRISVLASVPRVLDLLQSYVVNNTLNLNQRITAAGPLNPWQRWWHFRDVHSLFGFKFWAFVCGGASLTPASEQFWSRLGFVVVQGYGMTETTALVSLNHPFHARQGTIGQILPGREVKLSEDGEVLVRGETISNSIWQNGKIHQQDSEWLHTGDLADLDSAGHLKFRGRKKEVIVTAAGLNIHPEDLEAALNRQTGVKAAAVIESQTPTGPEPLAILVLAPQIAIETVIDGANATLADYQKIRRWHQWTQPDLPRTSTGKILKRAIVLEASPSSEGDLSLDSLGRVELQAQVEQQFGVSLSDHQLETIRTRSDLDLLISAGTLTPAEKSPHRYLKWPLNPAVQFLRAMFIEAIALPVLRLLAKPSLAHQPTSWPTGPALIICNHITSYDAPFVLFALPPNIRRRVAIAMSGEMLLDYRRAKTHWLSPLAYWLVTILFNVFPLPRSAGFKDSFRHAGWAVDHGYSILIFPEGHRSDDGQPGPFRLGSGLLWKELGIPLIPIRIDGLGELKQSPARRWFRTGSISVHVGSALPADPNGNPETLTQTMRHSLFP